MRLSKLLKIIDPDSTISVVKAKSRIAVFEGDARDFSDDREWKVKKIDNSYTCNFEIYVKEVKKQEDGVVKGADVYKALKNAPL